MTVYILSFYIFTITIRWFLILTALILLWYKYICISSHLHIKIFSFKKNHVCSFLCLHYQILLIYIILEFYFRFTWIKQLRCQKIWPGSIYTGYCSLPPGDQSCTHFIINDNMLYSRAIVNIFSLICIWKWKDQVKSFWQSCVLELYNFNFIPLWNDLPYFYLPFLFSRCFSP